VFKFFDSVSVSAEVGVEQAKKLEPSPKMFIVKKRFNKSFDKTKLERKIFKRRTNSSLGYTKNDKYMVVVNGSPVTKAHLALLKNLYESISSKTKVFGILLIKELSKLNYKTFGKITKSSQYSNFRSFLSDLFHQADQGQINRMVDLLAGNIQTAQTPLSEKIGQKRNMKRNLIAKIFQKFDSNNDGVLDLAELKHALEPNFTHEAIDELFKEHSKNKLNLEVTEFTQMFEGK